MDELEFVQNGELQILFYFFFFLEVIHQINFTLIVLLFPIK